MKAIVQEGYGSPDVLQLREIATPVAGDGQVLVKIAAASVNAADWHLVGRLPHLIGLLMRSPRSRVRGFDLAGTVAAVGRDVTRFRPGDEVFGTGAGSFAEFVATTEDRLAPKPGNLTFEQAAAIPVAGVTALQGLRDLARVRAGQRVLIHGAGGGVGTFAVQIARALGAHVIAVTCTRNLDLVRSIGAHEVVDYTRVDFTRRGQRHDVLFDLGADRSVADCRRVLAPEGILVLAGAPRRLWAIASRLLMARLASRAGGRRIASLLARVRQPDLVSLQQLAEEGSLVPVIERRYPLSEVPDAVRYVGTGAARGKVIVTIA
jgi:NADPH:quinone reductase-like Zn-dependent oxidoreductase